MKTKLKSQSFLYGTRALVLAANLAGLTPAAYGANITTIPHAIGVYLSPSGQEYFANQLDDILRRNRVELKNIPVANQRHETGVKTVEQLLPTNPSATNLIKTAKFYFQKFFRSQEIRFRNDHNFVVTADNIKVRLDWGKMGLGFSPKDSRSVRLNLELVLNNFLVTVNQVRLEDKQHPFLEKIGADNIVAGFARNAVPLTFTVPVDMKIVRNKFVFDVGAPSTNLQNVALEVDYKKPLLMPTVEIFVNGTRGRLRLNEIDRMLAQKKGELLDGLKKSAEEYLQENFAPKVKTIMEEQSNKQFTKATDMSPLGAPHARVPKMTYKLIPNYVNFKDQNLHFALDAFIRDPSEVGSSGVDDRLVGSVLGAQSRTLEASHDWDVAVTLNEGMINRLLQLSDKRGYYSHISSDSGARYRNIQRPEVRFSGRLPTSRDLAPSVRLKLYHNVTGFSSIAVNNPVEVEFELRVKLKVVDGKVQMISDGVDPSSVYVPRSSAAYEFLWPKVLSSAREQIVGMNLSNIVIADEIPIPNDLFGFPMQILRATTDPNGHIVVFMNYNR